MASLTVTNYVSQYSQMYFRSGSFDMLSSGELTTSIAEAAGLMPLCY